MENYQKILKKCNLFSGIDEKDLSALLGCLCAKKRCYKKREIILNEGDFIKDIGIIISGEAQILRMDYYGNRSVIATVYPSEVFGEVFACAGEKQSPVAVVAQTDSEILFIDMSKIISPCSNACLFHRQIIDNLLKVLAKKNLALQQKTQIISKRFTREKLLAFLYIQAKKHKSNKFYIEYDRQTLADYLEVDRSGLSAEIGKLQKEGILKSNKNYFELL